VGEVCCAKVDGTDRSACVARKGGHLHRIPANPRLKQDGSLVTKAFYRDKDYQDPLGDITDKVGVRFVVLLAKDIPIVCKALEETADWEWSKDKDYEKDIANEPYEFKYQSVHYIVRCRGKDIGGGMVAAGTPCEVQVRTLLQHAHSELTHDTIYKPTVMQTPDMHRAAAKAMALIESTNDYFEKLMELIETGVQPNKELSKQMTALYRELVGADPDPTKAEGLLNDAYAPFATDKPLDTMLQLVSEKPFIIERIQERAPGKLLFRQPSILLAYLGVSRRPGDAKAAWPLTPAEIKPIFTDLGFADPPS
jgi:ppGpp synthetase/RelA/SpoT-type nucleotidyltranferase